MTNIEANRIIQLWDELKPYDKQPTVFSPYLLEGIAHLNINVRNEFEQVVMSVLTDAEGDSLDDIPKGLVSRYEQHHVQPRQTFADKYKKKKNQ